MELSSLLRAIAWTFVHSFWIGLLAALLAAAIISSTKKSAASLRYNLLGTVMFVFIIAVVFVFLQQMTAFGNEAPVPAAANVISDGFIRTAIEFESPAADETGWFSNFSIWFDSNWDLLMTIWALFFLWNSLQLVFGLAAVHRLRVQRLQPVGYDWLNKFEALKKQLHITQPVTLIQSELIQVPAVVGFFRPMVLLPLGFVSNLPASQVEAILLHELAHIRRRDYLVNLVQHFVDTIFFFNPAVRWISSLIRLEREACCDDIVVHNTSHRKNYLEALIAFQEHSYHHNYIMAISSKKDYLFTRVQRIATLENKRLSLLEKISLLAGVLVFSAFSVINGPTYLTGKNPDKQVDSASDIVAISPEIFSTNHLQKVQVVDKKPSGRRTRDRSAIVDTIPAGTRNRPKTKKQNTIEISEESSPENTREISTEPAKEDTKEKEHEFNAEKKPEKKEMEPGSTQTIIDQKLEEIRQIKENIQVSKEIIGEKKKALNDMDPKKRELAKKELERERRNLEGKRRQLDGKRIELENEKKKNQHGIGKPQAGVKSKLFEKKGYQTVKNSATTLFSKQGSKLFETKMQRDFKLDDKKVSLKISKNESSDKFNPKNKVSADLKPVQTGDKKQVYEPKILKPSSKPIQ